MTQVVLAVLILVAVVIAVDAVRARRRARLPSIDIPALLADHLSQPQRSSAVVAILAGSSPAPSRAGFDIDAELRALMEVTTWQPKLAEGTEWRLFELKWGNDYGMVANPSRESHFRLEPWEVEMLPLMDGSRTVAEIIVDRFGEGSDLDPEGVVGLVRSLHHAEYLDPVPVDVEAAMADRLDEAGPMRRRLRLFAKELKIEWTGANRLVTALYRGGLRYVFTPVAAVLGVLIAVGGLVAFLVVQNSGRFSLTTHSAPIESLIFIVLGFVLTAAHELGHASVEVHYGRHIGGAGFMIYFGSPAFFVDSSDGMMMDRWPRILQSAAGPMFELVLAGIGAILLFLFPDWTIATFLYRFALLNLFVIFLNLIPLLELDGYWIFSDLIQVPDLRPRSLAFAQHELAHKLRVREGLTLQEWGLTAYALAGVAFTVFTLFTAFFFWKEIFGGMVSELWNGGPVSRFLLLILALFLGGPLIRGLISLARSIGRRLVALRSRIRFRLETRWRVEAAELIDALPAFEDLPAETLSDLAGRVQLRTIRLGQTVFRQGDRAKAFYVVRAGEVRIEVDHPESGDTQVLTVLRRGDAFGELGLIQATPRAATARASAETELFEVDRGTFDHLLSSSIDTPDFGLTLQAMAELKDLPAFTHLSSEGLASLLDHGAWLNAAPGDILVQQGAEGDAFYCLRSGQADVIRDGVLIDTIGRGGHFGETALLTDTPRNATVMAHTPVSTFRLSKEGFDNVIADAFRRGLLRAPSSRSKEH